MTARLMYMTAKVVYDWLFHIPPHTVPVPRSSRSLVSSTSSMSPPSAPIILKLKEGSSTRGLLLLIQEHRNFPNILKKHLTLLVRCTPVYSTIQL